MSMLLKIKKTVYGEPYLFKAEIHPNKYSCTVRQYCTDEILEAKIHITAKYIQLVKPILLRGYNNGLKSQAPIKQVHFLKIPKDKIQSVKEYITAY